MTPASSTRFYRLPQPARGSDANLLEGTQRIPSLASGANIVATVTVAVPAETAAGNYYLVGCADDTRLVTEKTRGTIAWQRGRRFSLSYHDRAVQ